MLRSSSTEQLYPYAPFAPWFDATPEVDEDVAFVGIGTTNRLAPDCLICATRTGTVYRSPNRGDNWLTSDSGTNALNDIAVRGQRVLLCGDGGFLAYSLDAGVTISSSSGGGGDDLLAVAWATDDLCFAVGDSGTILKSTDAGLTFAAQSSSVATTLRAVHFRDAFEGWCVGDAGTVLHTTDAGANWSSVQGMTGDGSAVYADAPGECSAFSWNGTQSSLWWKLIEESEMEFQEVVAEQRVTDVDRWECFSGMFLGSATPLAFVTVPMTGILACAHDSIVTMFACGLAAVDTEQLADHENRDGDTSEYTVSTDAWGGFTIDDVAVETETGDGVDAPCLKIAATWTQSAWAQILNPEPDGAGGWLDLPGMATVIIALDAGDPQVPLNAKLCEFLARVNHKRISTATATAAVFFEISQTTSGTFTITVDDQVTGNIPFDTSIGDLLIAVNALSGVDGVASAYGLANGTLPGTGYGSGLAAYLSFADGTPRAVSIDAQSLVPLPTPSAIIARLAQQALYRVFPVVLKDGVAFGAGPLAGYGAGASEAFAGWAQRAADFTLEIQELCWLYSVLGASCPFSNFFPNVACSPESAWGDWSESALDNNYSPPIWVPPFLSSGTVGPFTLGLGVQFWSETPGTFSIEILLDNLCLSWQYADREFHFPGGVPIAFWDCQAS